MFVHLIHIVSASTLYLHELLNCGISVDHDKFPPYNMIDISERAKIKQRGIFNIVIVVGYLSVFTSYRERFIQLVIIKVSGIVT